jgi:hypothetical protein
MTTDLLSVQLLNDAADIIEREGHAQKTMRDSYGRYCAVGAMREAARKRDVMKLYAQRAEVVLLRHLNAAQQVFTVANWNDEPGRTGSEVVATLRAVAALEKARHAKGATVTKPEEMAECG